MRQIESVNRVNVYKKIEMIPYKEISSDSNDDNVLRQSAPFIGFISKKISYLCRNFTYIDFTLLKLNMIYFDRNLVVGHMITKML